MFARIVRNVASSRTKISTFAFFPRKFGTDLTGKVLPPRGSGFKRPKSKDIVTLSQNALNRLRSINSTSNKVVYLCLRVKGCNGYVYEMKLVEPSELKEMDEQIRDSEGNLVLAIENKAAFYLLGSKVDYSEDDLSEGFTFDNPNVSSKCGCGQSFKF